MDANLRAWTEYGRFHLNRSTNPPEPKHMAWGFWDSGPGDEVLGDLAGCRVLDIGSGTGRYAAHLARTHSAVIDAVDGSPTQHQRALARYGETEPGVHFILADILEHLHQDEEPYDVVYALHSLGFIDPHQLLPALAPRIRPGGRLVFSVLHTNREGLGPSTTVRPRPENVRLGNEGMLSTAPPCGSSPLPCGRTCSSRPGSSSRTSPFYRRLKKMTRWSASSSPHTGPPG
ncbi:class I SAM-dependent methyltransferase [Streptomyces sp. ET3-23]|uniref:class I SAM-dependent methyltransferase n=1 Tax=Streptomyces sp. ET3-23 TaxID=2885643 RepID=UPI001D113392|nr:class I SAM-dependent methyltransferase [Streptomyces sp. ET3-23]MCC2280557.1 class I SAM-dependent methyltransferase [Streptomyces sp. ET3-23]